MYSVMCKKVARFICVNQEQDGFELKENFQRRELNSGRGEGVREIHCRGLEMVLVYGEMRGKYGGW